MWWTASAEFAVHVALSLGLYKIDLDMTLSLDLILEVAGNLSIGLVDSVALTLGMTYFPGRVASDVGAT